MPQISRCTITCVFSRSRTPPGGYVAQSPLALHGFEVATSQWLSVSFDCGPVFRTLFVYLSESSD